MSVMACIVPHGSHIIPELAGDLLQEFEVTRKAFQEIANAIYQFQPETIVIATPHGVKLEKHISIATSEWVGGSLADNGNEVSVDFPADREFARRLLDAAPKEHIPAIDTNYGTNAGPFSKVPLDWGALIPLWFIRELSPKAKVVLISPTRDIDLSNMVKLGELIGQTSEDLGRRTLLIASADQGHGHSETGPYGFAPESAEYDQLVCKLIQVQAWS